MRRPLPCVGDLLVIRKEFVGDAFDLCWRFARYLRRIRKLDEARYR